MSFFLEPPPLDSDLPPPLDDKLNDFDLEDEEAIEDTSRIDDDPELPTDFNVFSSAATDDSFTYSHQPPPDLFALSESPPMDRFRPSASQDPVASESPAKRDVAKEKESDLINEAVSQPSNDQTRRADTVVDEVASITESSEGKVSIAKDNEGEIPSQRTSVDSDNEATPVQEGVLPPEDTHNSDKAVEDERLPVEANARHVNEFPATTLEPEIEDDDEFEDFVEAAPSVVEALKTEETLGSLEVDEFSAFSTNVDIPDEPIPELKLDDVEEDDDFNDFETAIPVNRQVETVRMVDQVEHKPEVEFVADFSSFGAFSEPAVESNFEEFQGFKSSGFESGKEIPQFEDDDDDDFGDFNDFTQAPPAPAPVAQPQQVENLAVTKPDNVNGLLDMMFPPKDSETPQETAITGSTFDGEVAKQQLMIKSDNFVNKFNDFDATLALGYLYNNSKSSRTLVKALGIDTRNILQGPQWASSSSANSSNMPRFATNLSFSPIEPLKPSLTASKPPADAPPAILQPQKASSDVAPVPEVEFDWNSSGLVNPLDGPQPKPQQPHDHEPTLAKQQPAAPAAAAAPPAYPFENEPPLYGVDQEAPQVLEAETKAHSGHKPELGDVSAAYQWSNETPAPAFGTPAPSSNLVVRERTIKLPETHIFTPVKGTSPVAREVTSRDTSPAPDDPYFKGPITVKEYHDVEYSLEPKKKIETDVDFDEFQSAQPSSEPPLVPLAVLEPTRVEKAANDIKWPEPGNVTQTTSSDLDFLTLTTPPPQKTSFTLPLAAPTIPPLAQPPLTLKKKEASFSKPVIGTSPTQLNGDGEEDDFNDFQAAPQQMAPMQLTQAPPQQPQKVKSNDPITLSPARLAANQPSNQKSMWISSMDNDEISRIEAAFPKCKPERKDAGLIKHDDEDDWTDFVGASQPSSLPFSQSQPPSTISSISMNSNPPRLSNGDADDWSDFVSVPPPVAKIPSAKPGASSSQIQSKPNFSSWNQPSRPYVNHTTSFLTNDAGVHGQQFTSANYPYVADKMPPRNSMTIHNNFSYGFNQHEMYSGMAPSAGTQRQPKPNGISTILPELDFAMPKNLINLPRSGQLDPGKK